MCPLLEVSSALEGLWFNWSYDYVVLMLPDNLRVFYLGQCSYCPKEAKLIYNSGYTVQDTYRINSPSRSSVGRVLVEHCILADAIYNCFWFIFRSVKNDITEVNNSNKNQNQNIFRDKSIQTWFFVVTRHMFKTNVHEGGRYGASTVRAVKISLR